ncbi:hypothetical protein NA57DRAFT_70414 [Rhizodiscina lignyota]|uniref:AB hydrolase-1 domain-containing protein n=1 Tax=Rhizodiscina lignyota TaxID=1504668 RepID=A0A9P4IQF1_9PEZI|nr:hypothetical protein NA57DRAFT_70414 [Rhizodiscina lignyota]
MSTDKWKVTKHMTTASNLRGYPRGAVSDFLPRPLRLAVKQFTPLNNISPSPGDVTLIVSGGICASKESFEPFFDALLSQSEKQNQDGKQDAAFRIRNIWIADPWNVAESYRLNEDLVGDEPHWLDHTRDLYHLINTFQSQLPPPIIGVGESWGAGHMIVLSTWHPRLFAGILALEPALGPGHPLMGADFNTRVVNWPAPPKFFPGAMVSRRPDRWATMDDAKRHLNKTPYYAQMDPRVREKAFAAELREVSDESSSYVTLATPKFVEAHHWGRGDPPLKGIPPYPPYEAPIPASRVVQGFHILEGPMFHEASKHVPCPVHFVWGNKSFLSNVPDFKESFYRRFGSAELAGGGMEKGQLTSTTVDGAGHAVSLIKPEETAEASVEWLNEMSRRWKEDWEARKKGPPFEKKLSDDWMDRVRALDKLANDHPGLAPKGRL